MASKAITIPEEDVTDISQLLKTAVRRFGDDFDESKVEVDERWDYHDTDIVPSHTSQRLVIFRARPPSQFFGCIRVRDEQTDKMLWDVFGKTGIYMGHVPAGCYFEAMMVDLKFITPR